MRLEVMRNRRLGRTGLVMLALACAAVPATAAASQAGHTAAAKTKTKTCGVSGSCAASLSSAPPPEPSTGGGGGGGGVGGTSPPPQPFSTFIVNAKPRTTPRIQPGSKLIEALNAGRRLVCAGYTRRDGSWFEFKLTTRTRMGIVYEIIDTIHNTAPAGVRFCAGLPHPFTTFSGKPARHARLPDGTLGYVGLLPPCTRSSTGAVVSTGPCVASIEKGRDPNNTIVRAQVPATTQGDPWGGV
jgi:hypothetical protein